MKAISIMYHDVVASGRWDESGFAGADAALYKLGRKEFARHLAVIASAVEEGPALATDLNASSTRARTPWLLTFDDGGVSAYTVAADMLEERGWRGHFFVTTDFIDTPTFLSRAQIRELRQRGHLIGSHSSSHPLRMARCSREEVLGEWTTSLKSLSDVLGEAVTVASVPGGYYARHIAEAAASAGLTRLFTSEPTTSCIEIEGCVVLGRYSVQRWTKAETVAAIASGKALPRLRQRTLWEAKKITKRLGGEYYLKVRQALIGDG